jgi:hypothetical protein
LANRERYRTTGLAGRCKDGLLDEVRHLRGRPSYQGGGCCRPDTVLGVAGEHDESTLDNWGLCPLAEHSEKSSSSPALRRCTSQPRKDAPHGGRRAEYAEPEPEREGGFDKIFPSLESRWAMDGGDALRHGHAQR